MPLYDFHCRACGHRFEALARHDERPACRSCQGSDVERLPSTFAVSSEESRRKSATSARRKAAAVGRHERIAEERAIEQHRREDH
jgi:putative FmdB family regulatory protein